MAFIVTAVNKSVKFWLRGTTWAFHADRADVFETEEAAEAAIKKAEKFMAPSIRRACRIQSTHLEEQQP